MCQNRRGGAQRIGRHDDMQSLEHRRHVQRARRARRRKGLLEHWQYLPCLGEGGSPSAWFESLDRAFKHEGEFQLAGIIALQGEAHFGQILGHFVDGKFPAGIVP
ncbi:hypothetical protein N185_17250 [Sinorhizobium sp. GW3]|nr:hypothetical protein N185_17250 [Sinorhizobium sp. GW3]